MGDKAQMRNRADFKTCPKLEWNNLKITLLELLIYLYIRSSMLPGATEITN